MSGTRKLLLLVTVSALVTLPAGSAGAAPIGWTVTPGVASNGFTSVSCASSTFCAAVGEEGTAYVYNGSTWTENYSNSSHPVLDAVSCGSPTMCVAGGATLHSYLIWNGSSWSLDPFPTGDTSEAIQSLSCVTAAFCLAVDGAGNSIAFDGSSWGSPLATNETGSMSSVSCVTSLFCEAVDSAGNAYTYTGGKFASWSMPTGIDNSLYFFGVSCATTSFCMAVDYNFGEATIGSGGAWSKPQKEDGTGGSLNSVSCPNVQFCMAGDGSGNVLNYDQGLWASTPVFPGSGISRQVSGISCPSFTFCVAVAQGGDVAVYHGPTAPSVVTEQASSVTQTSATLNATVNPNGSFVTYCLIDWGTSTSYGHTTTCTPSPGAGTAAVPVLTSLGGLQPDTTYHFTVVATNAGGTTVGQDQTFTTAAQSPPPPPPTRTLTLGVPFSPLHSIPLVSATTPSSAPIVLLQPGGHTGALGHVTQRVLTIEYAPSSDPSHELQSWWQAVEQGHRGLAETLTLTATTPGLPPAQLTFTTALPLSSSTRVVGGQTVQVMRIEYRRASTDTLPTSSAGHGSFHGKAASLTMSCSSTLVACSGTVKLEALRSRKQVIVASASYTLASGAAGTVFANLTAAGRRLIHHLRSIRLTAVSTCSCVSGMVLSTLHAIVFSTTHGTPATGWSVLLAGQRYPVASVTGLPAAPPPGGSAAPGRVTFDLPVSRATGFKQWLSAITSGQAHAMTVLFSDTLTGKTLQFQLTGALPVSIVAFGTGSTLVDRVTLSYASLG